MRSCGKMLARVLGISYWYLTRLEDDFLFFLIAFCGLRTIIIINKSNGLAVLRVNCKQTPQTLS